jgi:hypothetical protein
MDRLERDHDLGWWLQSQGGAAEAVPRPTVVPLRRDGVKLVRPDGTLWKYRFVTGFRGPELYAIGEHGWLEDFYGAVIDHGGNGVRVFTIWNNTKYWPHSRPDYYDKLWEFCEHAQSFGLYIHLVAFCDQVDNSDVRLTTADQDEHMEQCLAITRERYGQVLLEVENESFKNGNNALASRFPDEMFEGILAMRSSWEDGADPSLGGWLSLATKHLDRGIEWTRKPKTLHEIQFEGLGAYPPAKIPGLSGEPERIGNGQGMVTNPRQHADNAACAELMGLGGCLHGGYSSFDADHDSDLQNCCFRGSANAMACAQAVADVWKSSVWDLRVGSTEHLDRGTENNDGPIPVTHWDRFNSGSPNNHPNDGACRTYFKLLDGKYYGLSCDPAPQWPGYQERNGWRIVARGGFDDDGHGGNMIVCQR